MKIGIDARFYRTETGGIGRYTRGLLHELAKIDQKNQYTVFVTPKDKPEYDIKAPNFRVKIVDIIHYSLTEQTKFLKILSEGKFDLVHFLNFNHPIFYKKPFITTVHDLTMLLYPVGRQQKSWLRRFAFKKVMTNAVKNSQAVIAVSQTTKKDCIKYLGANPRNIKIIYEAVNQKYGPIKANEAKKFTPLGNEVSPAGLMKLRSYLLFVSQWRPHKGLPELIRAFEIIKSKYPTSPRLRGTSKINIADLKLVIAGKSNKDFPQIPFIIHNSKFRNSIITPGFVADPDLQILYQNAAAFVFPSFYEGFGLGPLEAMACGCPVISSNLSCMPEILGNAAKYFDPNNIDEIAKTIYQVLTDKVLQDKMRQAGLRQVQKYSWQKMAKETLEVYKSVL